MMHEPLFVCLYERKLLWFTNTYLLVLDSYKDLRVLVKFKKNKKRDVLVSSML